jgi:hypothetical protein
MYNKRETNIFQVAEIMLEQDKSFEEVSRHVDLPEEQRKTLEIAAIRSNMPIKDYMKSAAFYNWPSIIGCPLRWWLMKTFAEQIVSILMFLVMLFLLFVAIFFDSSRYN